KGRLRMSTLLSPLGTVSVGGKEYPYLRRWSGERLLPSDGYLSFDAETEVVDLRQEIPRIALAAASASETSSCLIHPSDIGNFIQLHKGLHFICHNAAFDFWVVEQHLRQQGAEAARQCWWQIADQNRLHDSILLDMLVRLARDDSYPSPRDLAVLARHYAGLE